MVDDPYKAVNIFLDVGACGGTTFDLFLAKTDQYNGWRVYCFEPSPRHWPGLLQRADHYRHQYDIVLCPFGMAGKTGFLPFYEKEEPSGDSFIKDYFVNAGTRHFLCPVVEAGPFLHSIIQPGDNLHVKLDCEGGEYGILPSLLQWVDVWKAIDRLLVEFHKGEPKEGMMQALIDQCAKKGRAVEMWTL